MINAKSIRFPCRYLHSWNGEFGPRAQTRNAISEFKLGPGPCGKTVKKLEAACKEGVLAIRQTTSDGKSTLFSYPLHTIEGRIEIEEA